MLPPHRSRPPRHKAADHCLAGTTYHFCSSIWNEQGLPQRGRRPSWGTATRICSHQRTSAGAAPSSTGASAAFRCALLKVTALSIAPGNYDCMLWLQDASVLGQDTAINSTAAYRWAAAQQLRTKEPQEAPRPAQPLALWLLHRTCYISPERAPQSKVAQKHSMLEKRCKPGTGITTLILRSYKHLLAFTTAHWQTGSYRNLKYPLRLRCPLSDHEFIYSY